jgi:hypothetical protein
MSLRTVALLAIMLPMTGLLAGCLQPVAPGPAPMVAPPPPPPPPPPVPVVRG